MRGAGPGSRTWWLSGARALRVDARGEELTGHPTCPRNSHLRPLTYLCFAGHQAYAAYITSMHFFKHGVWQGVLLTMLASGELQS